MTRAPAVLAAVLALAAAPAVGGCAMTSKTLAFGTATKFALDISQRPDQMIEVVLGYDRVEIASIPAQEHDATRPHDTKQPDTDTYSVLGVFGVSYGSPWAEPLVIRQFFATGWAARDAAENPDMQRVFGRKAGEIDRQAEKEARAQRQKRGETK